MKLACLALSFLVFCSTAASAENAWLTDSITGCKAWADESSPSIRWDGQCKNGYAGGKGVLHTLPPKPGRYEGEMVGGKLNGPVRGIVPNSIYVVGDYKEGNPVGIHKSISKNEYSATNPISKYGSGEDTYKYQGGNLVLHIHKGLDGRTTEYKREYQNGKLVRRVYTYDGKSTESKDEYNDGKVVRSTSVNADGKASETKYEYQDGKVVRSTHVNANGKISETKNEYQDGKLSQSTHVDEDGKETKYEYQDGKLVKWINNSSYSFDVTTYEYQDGKLAKMVKKSVKESTKTKDETTDEYVDGKLIRKTRNTSESTLHPVGQTQYEYQDGTLVQEIFKRGDGSLTHTHKYQYQDGKLVQDIFTDEGRFASCHPCIWKYHPVFKNGNLTYEYEEVKVAERETPRPQESAATESPKDTDSGVGSFLGDLLGVVSSYHQGRGNTTKATQAEAIGAALTGDTARADAATSRLQAIASAEKAKKAQEQADKRAAQQAAQLQALQAEAGRKAAPQQQYETAETYQPTYQTGGNTYESNSGGISGGGSAGSAGKSTSKSAAKKEVISTSVISHGYFDNGRYNGYRVIVRNTGNVKTACQVDIRYVRQLDPTAINTRTYVDYTVVGLIMNPGESRTAEVALSDQNLSYKQYTVRDCQKFMF